MNPNRHKLMPTTMTREHEGEQLVFGTLSLRQHARLKSTNRLIYIVTLYPAIVPASKVASVLALVTRLHQLRL